MKTALYVRVSSDAQAEKGYSIEAQIEKLKTYCQLNNIYEYEQFVDAGYSGSSLIRPELQRLIQEITNHTTNTVIVYKLDRLSRKTKDTLYLVEDIFNTHNIKFVSLTENIDTSTSSGKFFLSILSSVAQLERENIKDRCIMGRKKKAESGIKSKSSTILYGYNFDNNTKQFSINDNEATHIKLIFQKFLNNESVTSIAKWILNTFKLHTTNATDYGVSGQIKQVWRIIENPNYNGKMLYNNELIEVKNLPKIIEDNTFQEAQQLMKTRRKTQTRVHSKHMLSGLLFCGVCGARLRSYYAQKNKWNYYICYSRGNNNPHMVKDKYCTLPYFNYEKLNERILDSIKNVIKDRTYYNKIKTKIIDYPQQIAFYENELKKLSDKANKVVDLLIDGTIDKDSLTSKLSAINEEKENIQTQISALKIAQSQETTIDYNKAKELFKALETATDSQKHDIIKQIIKKIVLQEDNHIDIYWNF